MSFGALASRSSARSAAARDAPGESYSTVRPAPVLAYGALGLPLAFAALPIYVHVPRLYATDVGLSLALVGAILLLARAVDAFTDPLIGWLADRIGNRRRLVLLALPVLLGGMFALLVPPSGAGGGWLLVSLVVVSLGYSFATIAYYAWGAEVAPTRDLRTRFVASREGFALGGVMLAAALPTLFVGDPSAMLRYATVFAGLLLVCAAITLLWAPTSPAAAGTAESPWRGLIAAIGDAAFARLLVVFAANGIAAAIPSATVLFFIDDVLRAETLSGAFLIAYFAAAALSLPLWVAAASRIGKVRAWAAGMGLAIVVFGWAATLGSGDVIAYAAICVLSGIALGADLVLPASLVADQLARAEGREDAGAGTRFGWWNFVTKANLALAAGLALPLLALLGYAPGAREATALGALAVVYAGVPIALKTVALTLLWRWRLAFDADEAQEIRRDAS